MGTSTMNTVNGELRDGVYYITLNRPKSKNALNLELLKDFYLALRDAEKQASPIVVIRGAGRSFTAGGDMVELRNENRQEAMPEGMEYLNQSILLIRELNAIVIAALEGSVAGAGVGILLSCDLSVAAKSAFINLAFRRVGLAPDGGTSMLLPRVIGAKHSNELFFFARNVDMNEAKALGLVNFVVDDEEFEERLDKILKDLKALPMESVKHFKDLTNAAVFSGLGDHLNRELTANCELVGRTSFAERLEMLFAGK